MPGFDNDDDFQQFRQAQQPIDPNAALGAPDLPVRAPPATFRQRFGANPQGQYAVFRQSRNIEDDRNRSMASKLAGDLVNTWNKSVLRGGLQKAGALPPAYPNEEESRPLPDTTTDPLASQAGYNSIKDIPVQKVIHPSWWSQWTNPQQRFAGGQLSTQEMADRMEDIHSEVDPTRSDLDRTMDPLVDRYNRGGLRNVPVENSANVDPIARPPGTVELDEDIDL